jgi:hypothetical protein
MNVKINKDVVFDYSKPPLIIGEISSNHSGSKKKFLELINAAYDNNADLVKIQTYEPIDITFNNDHRKFLIEKGIWKGENLWDLYQKAHTPFSWHEDAFKLAKKRNKILFSTPFSIRSLNFLKQFNPQIYKLSSFEITDLNLIKEIAKTKRPIIISTGASNLKLMRNLSIRKIIINKKIDVVISCCGSSLYDLFSFKMPTIGIKCSEDQNNAHSFYSKKNAIIGSHIQNIKKDLNRLNYNKRIMLVKNSQKYYNFNGKYALRNKIVKLINKND